MWIPLLLLLASPALLEASTRPARRSYDTHDYYVLHHNPSHGSSPQESAAALGAEFVEQVGELRDHYLVRTRKRSLTSLDPRSPETSSEDPVVASLKTLRRRADPLSYSVRSLEPQILRRRVKRAPVPDFPDLAEIESSLGIQDPIFSSQWHIVNKDHPE
jgi:kexin